jgi:Ca2+-binding RTX toxin-like protein
VRFDLYIDLTDGVIAANATTHGIADWSIVENAYSGSGNDRLVGNDAANILISGDGNDTIQGGLGNDTIDGGMGADTVVYAGNKAEYGMSWDPNTETLTITDNLATGGDDGIDTLTGIEHVVFADAEVSLSSTVGNRAPVANTTFFDTPIFVNSGMGIDFVLPDDAFSDADSDQAMTLVELLINVTDAAGGELPDWLSFDPVQNLSAYRLRIMLVS